jgi:hypothetical protein
LDCVEHGCNLLGRSLSYRSCRTLSHDQRRSMRAIEIPKLNALAMLTSG